ncbi:hypothetical protein V6N13_107269 [Hibiscus sabdariffa]
MVGVEFDRDLQLVLLKSLPMISTKRFNFNVKVYCSGKYTGVSFVSATSFVAEPNKVLVLSGLDDHVKD